MTLNSDNKNLECDYCEETGFENDDCLTSFGCDTCKIDWCQRCVDRGIRDESRGDGMEFKTHKITSVTWEIREGEELMKGPPKPERPYAGFIIYDKGQWNQKNQEKEQIYPGQIVMMNIDTMTFEAHEQKNQPHRPLCRNYFGIELVEL